MLRIGFRDAHAYRISRPVSSIGTSDPYPVPATAVLCRNPESTQHEARGFRCSFTAFDGRAVLDI
jgi:hypothetical protein